MLIDKLHILNQSYINHFLVDGRNTLIYMQYQLLVTKIPKPNVETLKKKEVEEEDENVNDPKN